MSFVKQPSEVFTFNIDYSPWLQSGETITSGFVLVDNVDIGSAGSVISNWSITNPYVYITVSGGLDNQSYLITSRITTSLSGIYEYDVEMQVKENASCAYVNDDFSYNLTFDTDTNTLYIMPTPSSVFKPNTQFDIKIKSGLQGYDTLSGIISLESDYSFWFTTNYCPLFSTLNIVKTIAGPSADKLLDAAIYRMILFNSRQAIDIYNATHSLNLPYDYFGCTREGAPVELRNYVDCKTAYDILSLIKQLNSSNGGSQAKTLGDLTIKYDGGGAPQNPNMDAPTKLKELYDCWNNAIRKIDGIKTTVKAFYDSSKGYSHPTNINSATENRINKTHGYLVNHEITPGWRTYRRTF